jgi:DnaJ-class molecular chaperone
MNGDKPAVGFADRARDRFDWFRDEVALDFPSLGAAADRMRESFVATDGTTAACEAEVHLTSSEAAAGPHVPVQVVVRSACAACGGRGRVWNGACCHCGGTGHGLTRHQVRVRLPSGVRDGARLLFNVEPHQGASTVVDLRVSVS